jgi:type I restriction enzyme S subunit
MPLWENSTLGKIATIQSGSGFPKKYQGSTGGEYYFYKVSDMNLPGNELYMNAASNTISEGVRDKLGAKVFPRNSIIFPKVGGAILTNKKRLTTSNCCVDNNIMGVLPKSEIVEHDFVYYFMSQVDIFEMSNKANPPSIRQSTVKDWPFPLPPLPEQQRIVAILDAAFERIDAAIANTEKNLANARELFESYLNEVFARKGEGWVEKKLSEVCSIISKLIDPRKSEFRALPHVGAGNMVSSSKDIVDIKTAEEEGLKSGKFTFNDSMVLYSKIRPYLMKVSVPDFEGLCSADVYPLYPKKQYLDRIFLFYLLLSKYFTDYAIAGSARAGMPKVNRNCLFNYRAFFPPVDEQRRLAENMDHVYENTRELEAICKKKLTALAELKQSILQKAFAGELTADMNQDAVAI